MWVIPIQTTTPTPEDVSCVRRQRLPSGTGAGIINSLPQLLLNVGGQVHDFTPPISCLPPEEPSAEKGGTLQNVLDRSGSGGGHGSLSSEVVAVVVGIEAVPVLTELVAQATVSVPQWGLSGISPTM